MKLNAALSGRDSHSINGVDLFSEPRILRGMISEDLATEFHALRFLGLL